MPPALGVTSTYTATYPTNAAGRLGCFLLTLPESTAQALVRPGLTSQGLVRIDLANICVSTFWQLDASGSKVISVPVPTDYLFQGFTFEAQSLDVDLAGPSIAWGDNDLTLTIGQGIIGQGLDLVPVAAGMFPMGSSSPVNSSPYFNQLQSQPVRQVSISLPFWIGRTEVTQTLYISVVGSNPSGFPVTPLRPVEQVSWNAAMAFCTALNNREQAGGRLPAGYEYRLPTEAEWEYCYRAGSTTEYYGGPTISCADANFGFELLGKVSCAYTETRDVGSYAPNSFGLHDMAGNVWEWCLDSWDGTANYAGAQVTDPYVQVGPLRVIRGGSWNYFSTDCRAAFRGSASPGDANNGIGFRIVLAPIVNRGNPVR
jgi:formylglycine-generating enzyme required for sulfatase activity